MKFLHLADLHIGKVVHGFSMLRDQEEMLKKLVDAARGKAVDAVLVAGDVYDTASPREKSITCFDDFLTGLAAAHIPVIVINGNHDSAERLRYVSRLLQNLSVHIISALDDNKAVPRISLRDDYGTVNFFAMPFMRPKEVRSLMEDESIIDETDAINARIKNTAIDGSERNVLLSHSFVSSNGKSPELGGSEFGIVGDEMLGTVGQISGSLFDVFDYVALGHIHKAQSIGRDTMRYAGALLKYSKREAQYEKHFPLVTIGKKGDAIKIERLTIKPPHDMRIIKSAFGKIGEEMEKQGIARDDYLHVILQDSEPIQNVLTLIRHDYAPNTMTVDYERLGERRGESRRRLSSIDDKTREEIFAEFYEHRVGEGQKMAADEWEALLMAAKEADEKGEAE